MSSKILSIPSSVHGMTQLNEDLFKKSISFPVLEVNCRDLPKIRGKVRLEQYLVKNLQHFKNTINADDETKKLLVFDPDVVKIDDEELKNDILEKVARVVGWFAKFSLMFVETTPTWNVREMDLTFDNWDMKSVIRAILPKGMEFSSFTQTGHIIHCNFLEDFASYKKILGDVLLRKINKAKTVVNKATGIASEFRNFQIELVAGEENYVTSVIERGITYKMDFSKVFWNSRLQHEHERIIRLLTKDSLVFDACAGIGPFVLPAAKQKRCRVVYANDLNPESIIWLKTNIEINNISADQVKTFNMDAIDFIKESVAKKLVEELLAVQAQCGDSESVHQVQGAHILMNLPGYSVNFLPAFKGLLSGKIANNFDQKHFFPIWVYCYLFVKAKEIMQPTWYEREAVEMVKEKLQWTGDSYDKFISHHHVRTVSSNKEMFCITISLPLEYLLDNSREIKEETQEEPQVKKLKVEGNLL